MINLLLDTLQQIKDEADAAAIDLCERPVDSYEKYYGQVQYRRGLLHAADILSNKLKGDRDD